MIKCLRNTKLLHNVWEMNSLSRRILSTSILAIGLAQNIFAQQTPHPAPASTEELKIWDMLMSAGWILVPLAILSFVVVGLVVFNLFWLRTKRVASHTFFDAADRYIADKNLEGLATYCEDSSEVVAKVVNRIILFAKANPHLDVEAIEKVAESEAGREAMRLNQPVQLLMDLGVMSPLFGLLGTVLGILKSFGNLASSDATPMRTMYLAGGVSQALVATLLGLGIALTAMVFYAVFRWRVNSLVSHLETTTTALMASIAARLAGK